MPQKIRMPSSSRPKIVAVGNLHAEEIAQHHRDEDVERDDADEEGGDQFDAVDKNVHRIARRHILRLGDSGNGSFRHETTSKLLTLPCQGEGAAKRRVETCKS